MPSPCTAMPKIEVLSRSFCGSGPLSRPTRAPQRLKNAISTPAKPSKFPSG